MIQIPDYDLFAFLSSALLRFTGSPESAFSVDPFRAGYFLRGGIKRVILNGSRSRRKPSLYRELFEPDKTPPIVALKERFRYGASVPRPIALDTRGMRGRYRPGERFTFDIILTGRLCRPQVVSALIFAVEEMSRRKGIGGEKWHLRSVDSIGPGDAVRAIHDAQRGTFTHDLLLHRLEDMMQRNRAAHTLHVELASPLQLRRKGQIVTELPFDLLLHALLTRLEMLQRYFCDRGETAATREGVDALVAAARGVQIRTSNLTWRAIPTPRERSLGGLLGSIVYEGDFTPFLPYLSFGALVGLGKKTSFGLGRFTLCTGDEEETREKRLP
ncbi:MAG: CRISPR system precrRNA processing endoribonuclease RAMP protein Cas6 [Deltaproteobacteria bacterium]|nr:MAG: CRISPR system precrRNA processing endoribonuclease RAMP protein Cas6 [Deltaproteobacteria bacterium]